MSSNHGPIGRHNFARQLSASLVNHVATSLTNKLIVLTRSNKTDFLGVFFLSNIETQLASNLTDQWFLVLANWQQHSLEILSLDSKQHIRLVFAIVNSTNQSQAIALRASALQLSIVTGGKKFGTHAIGVVKQFSELDFVVTHHARIGCAPDGILVNEIVDDPAKLFLEIQSVKRNAQPLGNPPAIFGVRRTTTTLFMIGSIIKHGQQWRRLDFSVNRTCLDRLLAMAHKHANHLVTLLDQKVSRDA